MASHTFSVPELSRFATAAYCALGVSQPKAELLADTLCQADLWGHQSHGVMRTFWYAKRIQSSATDVSADPSLTTDAGAVAVLDGNNGIGQIVAKEAMTEAISRATLHGIGAVSVRNSGHFGTAMYFTRMAALAGCIGMLFTNASPAMAPWGAREKRVGTNPWSIAAPAGRFSPMMLDIANTAVARGKLYLARQRGDSIPDGWALGPDGLETNNPVAGIAGTILPMAGHKGYAIASMIDILSGVLSGSGFLTRVTGPYEEEGKSGVGHLAVALRIEAFRPLADFNSDMEEWIDSVKATPKAKRAEEVFYPGELESRAETRNRRHGISVPEKTVLELNDQANRLGIPELLATG